MEAVQIQTEIIIIIGDITVTDTTGVAVMVAAITVVVDMEIVVTAAMGIAVVATEGVVTAVQDTTVTQTRMEIEIVLVIATITDTAVVAAPVSAIMVALEVYSILTHSGVDISGSETQEVTVIALGMVEAAVITMIMTIVTRIRIIITLPPLQMMVVMRIRTVITTVAFV